MNLLKDIPKPILVLSIIAIAVVVIMVANPPREACDAQLELFAQSQVGRLTSLGGGVGSLLGRTAKLCDSTGTLGGCAEFLETLQYTLKDIKTAPTECSEKLVSQDWLKPLLLSSMDLLVRKVWGTELPEVGPTMYSWMGPSEINEFCYLKYNVEKALGEEDFEAAVRKSILGLPHAKELTFEEAYKRSLFSARCEGFF